VFSASVWVPDGVSALYCSLHQEQAVIDLLDLIFPHNKCTKHL